MYELAPPFPGLSSRDDQTVAGLLMKMGGGVVLWTAITVLFARWYVTSERQSTEQSPAEGPGAFRDANYAGRGISVLGLDSPSEFADVSVR